MNARRTESGAQQKAGNSLVQPYDAARRTIGIVGGSLPLTLLIGGLILGLGVRPSLSAYFYTPLREVFVGTLCANAAFFWTYNGYDRKPGEWLSDRLATRIAALSAIGIALAPMLPGDAGSCVSLSQCLLGDGPAGAVHLVAAAVHFVMLALICLVVFTRGNSDTAEKRASNRVYRVGGWTILGVVAALAVLSFGPRPLRDALAPLRPVFWLETLAVVAFAASWLVKGDSLRPLIRAMIR